MLFTNQLRDDAVQVLRSLVGPVRSERGCSHTELTSAKENGAVVTWVSTWNRRSDLDRHLKSTHFRRLLAVMELAAERPIVEFESGGELRGLDLIHEVIDPDEDLRMSNPNDLESDISERKERS